MMVVERNGLQFGTRRPRLCMPRGYFLKISSRPGAKLFLTSIQITIFVNISKTEGRRANGPYFGTRHTTTWLVCLQAEIDKTECDIKYVTDILHQLESVISQLHRSGSSRRIGQLGEEMWPCENGQN